MAFNGVRLLPFATLAALACLMGSTAIGSTVKLLHNELEAFEIRLALIQEAQSTIDLASYEISDDNTSGRLFVALLQAAERGVVVRVLVDGHIGDNRIPKPLIQYLVQRGVAIRERPRDVRYQIELGRSRLHDKLLIADRTRLITGGRNLVQVHFGLGEKKCIDRDIYVEGESANHAALYFQQRWNEPKSGQPDLNRPEAPKMKALQVHRQWNDMPREQALEQVRLWLDTVALMDTPAKDFCSPTKEYDAADIDESHLRFLHDIVCEPKGTSGSIAPTLLGLLKKARHSIEIESPYLAVSSELKSILLDASNRGVQICLLTNSLESTDHVAVHAGFANERRWMLNAGIKIHEFCGPHRLHAKSMIIDRRITMVGSYNFDPLSEKRNSEVAMLITDCHFASQVADSMAAHRSHATEIRRADLFRYEARESNVLTEELRKFRRLRIAAPLIERYL